MKLSRAELVRLLETTILKPEGTRQEVITLCEDALKYNFVVVCTHPCYTALAKSIVKGSSTKVMTPVGFPFGDNTTAVKVFEAEDAIRNGADELDMMLAMGPFKDKMYDAVRDDIRAVVRVAGGRTVKVILETALLSREEKVTACHLAVEGGAQFVKTSTGNVFSGATVEDLKLMRQIVGPDFGVKASGGINELSQVLAFIEAGANRVASRSAVAIVNALQA